MSEAAHVAAVVAAVNAQNGNAYTLDAIKKLTTLPGAYTEVYVMRRLGGSPDRVGSLAPVDQWRVITRAVGKTFENAQVMRDRAHAALHDVALTVDGQTYYSRLALGDDPIGPDGDWYTGTSEFTY